MTSKLTSMFTGLWIVAISTMPGCTFSQIADEPSPEETGSSIAGIAVDYTDRTGVLAGFQIEAGGLQDKLAATSTEEGAFELGNIAEGSMIVPAVISRTGNRRYRPTVNPPIMVRDVALTRDVYAVSNPYITQQLTNVGLPEQVPATSVAIIELNNEQGIPLVGVPAADIVLLDEQGHLATADGPFFIGPNNRFHPTIDQGGIPAIETSEWHGGKARVAFLNIPVGVFQLVVENPASPTVPFVLDVVSVADAASVLRTDIAVSGPRPPTGPIHFTSDVYPLLQTVSQSGFGCAVAGCHTQFNPSPLPLLHFDKEPTEVYDDIINELGMVDIVDPTGSELYTKPLRELTVEQNHPNFTCPTANAPPCGQILAWIRSGASM